MFSPHKRIRNDLNLPFMCRSVGKCDFSRRKNLFSSGNLHNFVQMFWCLNGYGSIKLFGEVFPFTDGNVFWYLPFEDHCISAESENFQAAFVTFDGPLAAASLLAFQYPRLLQTKRPFPEHIFQNLSSLLIKDDTDSIRKTAPLIMELMETAGESGEKVFHKSQIVEHFVDIVQKSFSDSSLNINAIADEIGVHRSTLSRLVWKKIHRKPQGFLMSLRLEYGLNLLAGTDLPVKEVAKSCGLPNVSLFDKMVRRESGMTPTEYRISMQKNI